MTIEASVVIPTYNRVHQLKLTLAAFENQTFPNTSFEVIVVNDGSDDATVEFLENYNPLYALRWVSNTKNRGRSAARNLGVKLARGDIIIFCDSDFLVRPNFVSTHAEYHCKHPHAVVSGVPESWVGAYTHYYPEFSQDQKCHMRDVLQRANLWDDSILEQNHVVDILTPADVRTNSEKVEQVIAWYMDRQARAECKRLDVAPWLVFVTRCVSVRREDFNQTGGFNEEFVHYGLEDWELGYRLARNGVSFICVDEMIGYHQEHPVSYRGVDGNRENLKVIYKRHGTTDPELAFMSITPPWLDFHGYKENLRKLRALCDPLAPLPSTADPIRLVDETTTVCASQPFCIAEPYGQSPLDVPVYYWPVLPNFEPRVFHKHVVRGDIEIDDSMWLPRASGGGLNPTGLAFFYTTFRLDQPTDVSISVSYANSLALVYIDNNPVALKSAHPRLTFAPYGLDFREQCSVTLAAGEHVVVVEALSAGKAAEQTGVKMMVVDAKTTRQLASSSNPAQWRSTGYVRVPPVGWYKQPREAIVHLFMWNSATSTLRRVATRTVRVLEK